MKASTSRVEKEKQFELLGRDPADIDILDEDDEMKIYLWTSTQNKKDFLRCDGAAPGSAALP
eukprot:7479091-Heterocapsa_arctica.AAC.1